MTDATAIEDRDEQVAEALSAGRSLRLIQRDFSLSVAELDQALEKLWPVSNDAQSWGSRPCSASTCRRAGCLAAPSAAALRSRPLVWAAVLVARGKDKTCGPAQNLSAIT